MSRLFVFILIAHLQVQTPVDANDTPCNETHLDAYREYAVMMHNNYRAYVALGLSISGQEVTPTAANMEEMQYSCKLEQKAAKLIESCPETLGPAPLENLEYNAEVVKEVDAMTALVTALFHWATKYQTLKGKWSLIPSSITTSALPFYMMMNAETTRLGCSIKECRHNYYYISCYYGDKLATSGVPIYIRGEPCTQCPNGTECHSIEGLCFS